MWTGPLAYGKAEVIRVRLKSVIFIVFIQGDKDS
jgi:hypothetical protein